MTDIDAQIVSLMHAAARHGCDGCGWNMPWRQPGGDIFSSDGRILIRAPAAHCVGLRIDLGFYLDGIDQIFEGFDPSEVCWALPRGVTGGLRAIKVGGIFLMARYVGLLMAHGVDCVIPDRRPGQLVGFTMGPLEGLLQPMEIGQDQAVRKPWGGTR